MQFQVIADTDIGTSKTTNQDSLLVKHGKGNQEEVLMAVICDGMGGLSKGELASATVIREFSKWFDEELPFELHHLDMHVIGEKWSLHLKELNRKISKYAQEEYIKMGTTFTGVLFAGQKYLVVHVGDTRFYQIDSSMKQLTLDQTFVAREIIRGNMTKEQAKKDKRRNMLLQCIGASEYVEPQILHGTIQKGAYMLCSDGFRHEITEREMYESLNPINFVNKEAMHANVHYLINQVKKRQEKDNISVILIRVD